MKILKVDIPEIVTPGSTFMIHIIAEIPVLRSNQIAGINVYAGGTPGDEAPRLGYQMSTSIAGTTRFDIRCKASYWLTGGGEYWRRGRGGGMITDLPEGEYPLKATGSIWQGYATWSGFRYYGREPLEEYSFGDIGLLVIKEAHSEDKIPFPWRRRS